MKNSFIKSIDIPKEHGGWGFIAESALIGLVLAFSINGVLLVLFFILLFLVSQPLKIFLQDTLQKRKLERTFVARSFAFAYLFVAVILFLFIRMSTQRLFWVPVALCLGLSLFQFIASVFKKEKSFFAEILGACAIALCSSAVLIAGGTSVVFAFLVWSLLAIRIVTSVIYVRNLLNKAKGLAFSQNNVLIAQLSGLLILSGIIFVNEFSCIIILGYLILMVRAVYGISNRTKDLRPQKIGILEIVFGLINSICIILGVG